LCKVAIDETKAILPLQPKEEQAVRARADWEREDAEEGETVRKESG
jgi:hypothetical protein